MSTMELSAEALSIISKVEKLFALAGNNDNEHQAAAAMAKGMELLAAYNLDVAVVGKADRGVARADTKLKGGLYGWQRDLWKAVSELNFCLYRSIRGTEKGSSYEHRVIGSRVNVVSARVMAEYLQQTIERLAQDWARDEGCVSVFVKAAIAYREGMADRLVSRLQELRRQRLAADEAEKRQTATAARHPSAAPGTALVLADVIQTEADFNTDHINGLAPGTTARQRAEANARRAAAQAEADRLIRERDEAEARDPSLKEARLRKDAEIKAEADKWWASYEKRQQRNARRRKGGGYYRAETPREERRGMASFGQGYAKGGDIGLDPQVGGAARNKLTR